MTAQGAGSEGWRQGVDSARTFPLEYTVVRCEIRLQLLEGYRSYEMVT
jgi:hypothetical protein